MCQIRKVDDWDSQVDYIYDILYPRTRTVAQQSKDQNVERSMLNKQIDEIDKLVAKYDVQLHYNAMGSKVANKNLLEINKVLAEIEELIVYMNLIL